MCRICNSLLLQVTLSDGDLSSLANMKLNLDLNQLNLKSGLLEPTREVKILVTLISYSDYDFKAKL